MKEELVHICPSLLMECKGKEGYSKKALKMLFNGRVEYLGNCPIPGLMIMKPLRLL